MNWKRLAEQRLQELYTQFPAVVVVGAKQVGKTTLAREVLGFRELRDEGGCEDLAEYTAYEQRVRRFIPGSY